MAGDTTIRIFFVSFAIQTLLLGLFLSMSFMSLYFMVRRRAQKIPPNRLIFWGVCALIASVTAHWAVSFAQLFTALLSPDVSNPSRYITNADHPLYFSKTVLLYFSSFIANMLLIHRLYVVWRDKILVIVFPIVLLVASMTSEIYDLHIHFAGQTAGSTFRKPYSSWIITIFSLDLALNTYGTLMIAWRIWKCAHCGLRLSSPWLSESLIIFTESAGALLAFALVSFIAYTLHQPVFVLFMDNTPVAAASGYVLINVRVSLGIAREGATSKASALEWAVAPNPATESPTQETFGFACQAVGEGADDKDKRICAAHGTSDTMVALSLDASDRTNTSLSVLESSTL